MRELLIVFILALIVGSIINGMQQKPVNSPPTNAAPNAAPNAAQGITNTPPAETNAYSPRRDFPDFASFANINSDNFEEMVLKSNKPVFIDCYVPNNQACDQMIPLVAAVAKGHEDSVLMARLNIMDNVVLAHRYEISRVPTFLLFDQGALKGKISGISSQDRLESLIASLPSKAH